MTCWTNDPVISFHLKKGDWYNGCSFHLQTFLPLSSTNSTHSSSFFFCCLSQIHQIFALLGPGLFIFWSVFSALVGPVRWLNSAVSDMPVFDLAAGDGGLAGCGALSAPATLAVLLWASHTVAIHSPSTHRIEYGLFGGQWQCQECWALVPLWEKMVFRSLSPFFSFFLFLSMPLKAFSSLMRGITRCISWPVSSFLQIPDWPVRAGLPARGILRRATAFHIGISWPSPTSPWLNHSSSKDKTRQLYAHMEYNVHLRLLKFKT